MLCLEFYIYYLSSSYDLFNPPIKLNEYYITLNIVSFEVIIEYLYI